MRRPTVNSTLSRVSRLDSGEPFLSSEKKTAFCPLLEAFVMAHSTTFVSSSVFRGVHRQAVAKCGRGKVCRTSTTSCVFFAIAILIAARCPPTEYIAPFKITTSQEPPMRRRASGLGMPTNPYPSCVCRFSAVRTHIAEQLFYLLLLESVYRAWCWRQRCRGNPAMDGMFSGLVSPQTCKFAGVMGKSVFLRHFNAGYSCVPTRILDSH